MNENYTEDTIRTNVRNLLEYHKISQSKLAKIFGISVSRVNAQLNNSNITLEFIVKCRQLFNVSMDDLMFKDLSIEDIRDNYNTLNLVEA